MDTSGNIKHPLFPVPTLKHGMTLILRMKEGKNKCKSVVFRYNCKWNETFLFLFLLLEASRAAGRPSLKTGRS